MSSDLTAGALSRLQRSVDALDGRMSGLEQGQAAALDTTRRLGMDVVEMGSSLARRVRALEDDRRAAEAASAATPAVAEPVETPLFAAAPAAPPRRENIVPVTLGMGVLLAAVLGGFWLAEHPSAPASRAKAVVRSAPITARVAPPPVVAQPVTAPSVVATRAPVAPSAFKSKAPVHKSPTRPAVSHNATVKPSHETLADDADTPLGHVLYGVSTPPTAPTAAAPGPTPAKAAPNPS